MKPEDALKILDIATNPNNAGKLTRIDYGNCELALKVLADFVRANITKKNEQTRR